MNIKIRTSINPETGQQAMSIISDTHSLFFMDGKEPWEGTIERNFADLLYLPALMFECYEAGVLGEEEFIIDVSDVEWDDLIVYLDQYYV